MNRKQRRAHQRPRPIGRLRLMRDVTNPLAAVACPDCNSDIEIIEATPGYHRIEVRHDDSCPWYAQLKRDLS